MSIDGAVSEVGVDVGRILAACLSKVDVGVGGPSGRLVSRDVFRAARRLGRLFFTVIFALNVLEGPAEYDAFRPCWMLLSVTVASWGIKTISSRSVDEASSEPERGGLDETDHVLPWPFADTDPSEP